jgi:rare lipoprotein A
MACRSPSRTAKLRSILSAWTSSVVAILALGGLAGCDRGQPQPPPVAQRQPPPSPPKPKPPLPPTRTGVASYYGAEFAGKPTASGERFRPNALTAASRTLPLGTTAKVTNTETGRSVSVRVNDRGPYAKHRVVDVSSKAARRLGMTEDGVAPVKVQPLSVPPGASRSAEPQ